MARKVNVANTKARVRRPAAGSEGRMGGRSGAAGAAGAARRVSVNPMRSMVWPPGCPWPGVWVWPGYWGAEGPEGPGIPGVPEWSPEEARRTLGIAIAIAVAGLILGALLAAWAGGAIPGPDRLFGLFGLFGRARPRVESPGESPGGRAPVSPAPLPDRPSPGYPAPGIDGKAISGERLRLHDCAGHVVVLTFFSTASGASLAHVSVLAQIHSEGLSKDSTGIRIVTIAVAEKEDAVRRYMEARQLDLPVIADPRGELARLYDITAVPTTFIIDAQGVISDLRVGAMTRAQLERAIRSAL